MDNLQSSHELPSLQTTVTSESSIQSSQSCEKMGEENLVRQIDRM